MGKVSSCRTELSPNQAKAVSAQNPFARFRIYGASLFIIASCAQDMSYMNKDSQAYATSVTDHILRPGLLRFERS